MESPSLSRASTVDRHPAPRAALAGDEDHLRRRRPRGAPLHRAGRRSPTSTSRTSRTALGPQADLEVLVAAPGLPAPHPRRRGGERPPHPRGDRRLPRRRLLRLSVATIRRRRRTADSRHHRSGTASSTSRRSPTTATRTASGATATSRSARTGSAGPPACSSSGSEGAGSVDRRGLRLPRRRRGLERTR
jgi:hypothetical protein